LQLNLKDKIAIVTGGASGVGRGIAMGLAEELACIVIADINVEKALKVKDVIGEKFPEAACIALEVDVTCEKSVKHLVQETVDRFGSVHILVNNVGVAIPHFIQDVTEKDFKTTMDVNVKGAVHCVKAVSQYMKRQRFGRIINISSMSGVVGSAGLSVYSMSKFALRGLTHALGRELGRFGITVNAIAPTDIYETGSWSQNPSLYEISIKKEGVRSPEELIKRRIGKIPVRRACTIEDVANLVVFLSSERADFINCQTILLNGGLMPT
jgi:sorbitol-6-phosphate 2-dehydrogenase